MRSYLCTVIAKRSTHIRLDCDCAHARMYVRTRVTLVKIDYCISRCGTVHKSCIIVQVSMMMFRSKRFRELTVDRTHVALQRTGGAVGRTGVALQMTGIALPRTSVGATPSWIKRDTALNQVESECKLKNGLLSEQLNVL